MDDKKASLTASVVLFKTNPTVVKRIIDCFERSSVKSKLYLIDNSPDRSLESFCQRDFCTYIFSGKNLGYGKANNLAIKEILYDAKYHLVCNPDIFFDGDVLERLIDFMNKDDSIGQIMPRILYPDGTIQHLCKMLPTPIDLFFRRFVPWLGVAKKRNQDYELRSSGYNKVMNVPYLSGCFMFLRTSALKKVGLFEEKIHLYIEDADLTRRIHKFFKTIFLPTISVYHDYGKGSYKSTRLTLWNIHGATVYFNKWGWFKDTERDQINQELRELYLSN
ncbi:MAG: glycosyltransferase [Bacteroidetes bacterium]|nr:glycosyltransferase [Bacteroidota bacterium]